MATFNELASIAHSSAFQSRVEAAMHKVALEVMVEDASVPDHSERATYAMTILDGGGKPGEYTKSVVMEQSIADVAVPGVSPEYGISDAELESAVNAIYNAKAGIHSQPAGA